MIDCVEIRWLWLGFERFCVWAHTAYIFVVVGILQAIRYINRPNNAQNWWLSSFSDLQNGCRRSFCRLFVVVDFYNEDLASEEKKKIFVVKLTVKVFMGQHLVNNWFLLSSDFQDGAVGHFVCLRELWPAYMVCVPVERYMSRSL